MHFDEENNMELEGTMKKSSRMCSPDVVQYTISNDILMSYGLTRSLELKRLELLKCSNVDGNNLRLLPSVVVIVLYIESSMSISDDKENVIFVGPTHLNIAP